MPSSASSGASSSRWPSPGCSRRPARACAPRTGRSRRTRRPTTPAGSALRAPSAAAIAARARRRPSPRCCASARTGRASRRRPPAARAATTRRRTATGSSSRSRRPPAAAAASRSGRARCRSRSSGASGRRGRSRRRGSRAPSGRRTARATARRPGRAPWGNYPLSMALAPSSVDDVDAGLRSVGYLPGESTALVSFLAARLGKPVLVEGPAGVGKTELAKALASFLDRTLVRLQCYEGLDEAKALYEWNYRKQLLRIQAEAAGTGWDAVQDDIFGEEFLLARPLMVAIASTEPVVLLIDEIDKTDQEFEAMLLELLSDFQISIPELGRIEARTHPVVLLTSNNSRELTEALKRRCLYLWLDYPSREHELEIVRLHAPALPEKVAAKLVDVIAQVRELDLKKPPSIAESIDWARALLLLGADEIDEDVFRATMSIIVKHRTDLDVVAERVGVRLGLAPRPA